MVLKLTAEDVQELRRLLASAQTELLRDLEGLAGCGYSSRGIDLCHRKSRVEHLIDCLDRTPGLQMVPQPVRRESRLTRAA